MLMVGPELSSCWFSRYSHPNYIEPSDALFSEGAYRSVSSFRWIIQNARAHPIQGYKKRCIVARIRAR
jgi:hypothetical protein